MPSQNQLKDSILNQLKSAEQEERNRKQKLITEMDGMLRETDCGSYRRKESQVKKLIKQISERKIRPFLSSESDASPKHKISRRHSSPACSGSPGFDALQNILDRHLSPQRNTDPLHRRGSCNVAGVSRRVSEESDLLEILNDNFFTSPDSKDSDSLSCDLENISENVFDDSLDTYFKDGKVCTWC